MFFSAGPCYLAKTMSCKENTAATDSLSNTYHILTKLFWLFESVPPDITWTWSSSADTTHIWYSIIWSARSKCPNSWQTTQRSHLDMANLNKLWHICKKAKEIDFYRYEDNFNGCNETCDLYEGSYLLVEIFLFGLCCIFSFLFANTSVLLL